eukprot:gene5038-129_t
MGTRRILEGVTREHLIARCVELERTLLRHNIPIPTISHHNSNGSKKKTGSRPFDFNRYSKRKIALKIAYLGEKYHGLAIQESVPDTVEAHLFAALQKAKLIEDWKVSDYSRCGRTDKGVSAFAQVVSLVVRSNLTSCRGLISGPSEPSSKKPKGEIDYTKILNRLLPDDIRVMDWGEVDEDFSARFNCKARHYKYFFHRDGLNIDAMQEACRYLCGEHDFRNFCKANVSAGIINHVRTILSAEIRSLKVSGVCTSGLGHHELWEFNVIGQAFLWHQVRCMMAVLLMVGQGLEEPAIVKYLLDTKECTHKPQYQMADDLPLVLYDCIFDSVDWQGSSAHEAARLDQMWLQQWQRNHIRNALLTTLLDVHGYIKTNDRNHERWRIFQAECHGAIQTTSHKPLIERPTEGSVYVDAFFRFAHYIDNRKVI